MAKVNYWIDVFLILSFFIVLITSIVLVFMPYGPHSSTVVFINLFKYQWKVIHVWSGFLFSFLGILHFFMHWKWMKKMSQGIFCKKEKN